MQTQVSPLQLNNISLNQKCLPTGVYKITWTDQLYISVSTYQYTNLYVYCTVWESVFTNLYVTVYTPSLYIPIVYTSL